VGVLQCKGFVNGFLDGNWHHIAAVASRTSGMRVYYDGQQVCFLNDTQDVDLSEAPTNPSLYVGRHGEGETQWDFSGHIDEVRIYNRPLSGAEISTLARRPQSVAPTPVRPLLRIALTTSVLATLACTEPNPGYHPRFQSDGEPARPRTPAIPFATPPATRRPSIFCAA
jgi:hypothetical protein